MTHITRRSLFRLGAVCVAALAVGVSAKIKEVYHGKKLIIVVGGETQTRTITAYNGTTKVAMLNEPWTTTPDANSVVAFLEVKDGQ